MNELDINEVPIDIRIRAYIIEVCYGWCFIVKKEDGQFSIHYNKMGVEITEDF